MRNFLSGVIAGAIMLAGNVCYGIVNFAEFSVEQVVSPETIWAAVGTSSTGHLAGVATYPAAEAPVYLAYDRGGGQLDVLKSDVQAGSATKLTDTARMANDLGMPYRQEFELVAGFAYMLDGNQLVFSDGISAGGEASILKVNVSTGLTSLVSRTTATEFYRDFALIDAAMMVATYQTTDTAAVGKMDGNGQWTGYLWESDLLAAVGPDAAELLLQAAGAGYGTDDVYVYCAGNNMLFYIEGFSRPDAVVSVLKNAHLAGAAVGDMAVDELGNLFVFDGARARILVYRKADGVVFGLPMDELWASGDAPGSIVRGVPPRGLAARRAGGSQVDLFIGTTDPAVGLLRVRFGDPNAQVSGWGLY